jgi:hypothetical protein
MGQEEKGQEEIGQKTKQKTLVSFDTQILEQQPT